MFNSLIQFRDSFIKPRIMATDIVPIYPATGMYLFIAGNLAVFINQLLCKEIRTKDNKRQPKTPSPN